MTTTALPRTLQLIHDGIDQGLHLGAQLYVSRRFAIVADLAIGQVSPSQPMRTDTLMPWLSSGKPITAVAIAQLWERGLLDLDDPVAHFIPEFAANNKDRITLRHLLTHTAGIRWVDTGHPHAPWDQVIARIAQMRPEPRWIPGQKAGYHVATSWFILGDIIRRLTGRPFDEYVRKEIFQPLGMADAHFALAPPQQQACADRLGTLYNTARQPPVPNDFESPAHRSAPSPGSSARGPIRQLGLFYEMLLNRGQPGPNSSSAGVGARLLLPQTIEALTARHRSGLFDHTFKANIDWGLGFLLHSVEAREHGLRYTYGPHASLRTAGHSGSQSSVGMFDPEHQLVIAAVFNGTPGEAAHQTRMKAILGAIYEDLGVAQQNDPAG